MDGEVRETCCSTCSLRDVCAHKEDYLAMVKSLDDIFYKFPENERTFMRLRDPDCKFYSKKLAMPRALLTQSIGFPENMVTTPSDLRKGCNRMIEAAEAVQNFNRKTDV